MQNNKVIGSPTFKNLHNKLIFEIEKMTNPTDDDPRDKHKMKSGWKRLSIGSSSSNHLFHNTVYDGEQARAATLYEHEKYDGEWQKGLPEGHGTMEINNYIIKGNFLKGNANGEMRITFKKDYKLGGKLFLKDDILDVLYENGKIILNQISRLIRNSETTHLVYMFYHFDMKALHVPIDKGAHIFPFLDPNYIKE